jgi:hypothetical protein
MAVEERIAAKQKETREWEAERQELARRCTAEKQEAVAARAWDWKPNDEIQCAAKLLST